MSRSSRSTNKIAVAMALANTDACLRALETLASRISLAEIRLDVMTSFDLPRLIASAPCPLIITCRPTREGGHFSGSEASRLDVLNEAMELGCAYVDIEWDCLAAVARQKRSPTQIIASRHWLDQMPAQLWPAYAELREYADIIKLVGLARRPADMLPVFDLLRSATGPVIGLAMGTAGQLTRLLAPCFPRCLLTFAAPSAAEATAAGQLSVSDMADLYHVDQIDPRTHIHLHLCAAPAAVQQIIQQNTAAMAGKIAHIPLVISPEEAADLLPGLRSAFPHLTITADPPLADRI